MKRLLAFTLVLILVLAVIPCGLAEKVIETQIRYEEMYVPTFLECLKTCLTDPDSLVLKDVGVVPMIVYERPYNFFAIYYEAKDEKGEVFEDLLTAIYAIEENPVNDLVPGALLAARVMPAPMTIAISEEATEEDRQKVSTDLVELIRLYIDDPEECRTSEYWHTLSTKGLFY